jgi:hypothetical protein
MRSAVALVLALAAALTAPAPALAAPLDLATSPPPASPPDLTLVLTPRRSAPDHHSRNRQRVIGLVAIVVGGAFLIGGLAVVIDGALRHEPSEILPLLCGEGPCPSPTSIRKPDISSRDEEIAAGSAALGAGAVLSGFAIPLIQARF